VSTPDTAADRGPRHPRTARWHDHLGSTSSSAALCADPLGRVSGYRSVRPSLGAALLGGGSRWRSAQPSSWLIAMSMARLIAMSATFFATGIQAIEAPKVGPAAARADAIWTARMVSWTITVIFNARTSAAATYRPPPTTMEPVPPS